jgi:hypothetical protein
VLAVVGILAISHWGLGLNGPWVELRPRVPKIQYLERGIATDRVEVQHLAQAPAREPRVIVVGSSQGNAAFFSDQAQQATRRKIAFGKIAHAGIGPFEVRTLVDELVALAPAVVVIVHSAFDSYRPLELVPQATFGSFSAMADLMETSGLAWSLAHRHDLYRLAAANALRAYRYRYVLQYAFADELRRFEFDERLRPPPIRTARFLAQSEGLYPVSDATRERALALFPDVFSGYREVRSMVRGPHVRINQSLLRRAVERLSEAGIRVMIVEAPLHPMTAELYDRTISAEFVGFARGLENDLGVRFIPHEATGTYAHGDFIDFVHLGASGSSRFTRVVASASAGLIPR